jgi:mycothiol synthase
VRLEVTATLRPPADADVDDVARLMSEHAPEPVDADLVRHEWSAPSFDREADARIEPGAYAQVERLDEGRVWIHMCGRPSAALVDWAEERARERDGRILSGSWVTDEGLVAELRRRGFGQIRHSFRMAIDLADDVAEPGWPDGVRVRTFREGDARTFYELQRETFADTWEPIDETYDEWAHWLLDDPSFDPGLWFVAEDGSEPAGFAICKRRRGDPELGYVQVLGVRRPWRGRGLGRALLLLAFRELRARGLARAGLGVDAENPTGATRLYESVGMRVTHRFEIYEKAVS